MYSIRICRSSVLWEWAWGSLAWAYALRVSMRITTPTCWTLTPSEYIQNTLRIHSEYTRNTLWIHAYFMLQNTCVNTSEYIRIQQIHDMRSREPREHILYLGVFGCILMYSTVFRLYFPCISRIPGRFLKSNFCCVLHACMYFWEKYKYTEIHLKYNKIQQNTNEYTEYVRVQRSPYSGAKVLDPHPALRYKFYSLTYTEGTW